MLKLISRIGAHGLLLTCGVLALNFSPSRASAQEEIMLLSHTGYCLDIRGGSTGNQAAAQVWTCHWGSNQRFEVVWVDLHYFELRAVHSGKCLDVTGASTSAGATVQQYDCHGGNNQLWSYEVTRDGLAIVARHSGMCLDVQGSTWGPGTNVIQYPCHYGANQLWEN